MVDWTATEDRLVRSTRRLGIWQGDSYEDEFRVVDADGNPFPVGPSLGTAWWTPKLQLRRDYADRTSELLAEALVTWTDETLGYGVYSLTPAQTLLLPPGRTLLRYDFQLVNVSDPDFEVGWTQTILFGRVLVQFEVTR